MKLCICRNVSDQNFTEHLAREGDVVQCAESALARCCGEPTNCGQCLDMADAIADAHNRRMETVLTLRSALPAPVTRLRETV
jgi:bacterioferritin-associated ferredoxin